MRFVKYLLTAFLLTLIFPSCGKIETLPPTPSIKFLSFQVFDTTDMLGNQIKGGRLKFHFEDGDGDLGLDPPDGYTGADTSNLFFKLYRIKNGITSPALANDPLMPSDYRIPYMERLGQNKILKGTVSITFLYFFYTPADTIKYKFVIKDRAEHMSDSAATCIIPVNVNGICNSPGN